MAVPRDRFRGDGFRGDRRRGGAPGVGAAGVDALGAKDDEGNQKFTLDEMSDTVEKIIRLVADDPTRLLRALDGDLGLLMQVLNTWMEGTEVGEAQDSPN